MIAIIMKLKLLFEVKEVKFNIIYERNRIIVVMRLLQLLSAFR